MIVLFVSFFASAIIFISIFLIKAVEDFRKQTMRPLLFLFVSIAFWVATLPAMLSPENLNSITYPTYNVIESNATSSLTLTFPVQTVTSISTFSQKTYNSYFYIWLGILFFLFFMMLIWWLNLLKNKAMQATAEGSDVMEEFDKNMAKAR